MGFPVTGNINITIISALSSTKPCLNFQSRYLGKRSLCTWNQPDFLKNSDKSLLSSEQNKLKYSETWFCRRKTSEDDNAKISVPPNIPCTFLLFKASAFFQIFFPRNLLFRQVLRTLVLVNSGYLIFLYLFISLLMNMHWKHQIKEQALLYLLTNLFL